MHRRERMVPIRCLVRSALAWVLLTATGCPCSMELTAFMGGGSCDAYADCCAQNPDSPSCAEADSLLAEAGGCTDACASELADLGGSGSCEAFADCCVLHPESVHCELSEDTLLANCVFPCDLERGNVVRNVPGACAQYRVCCAENPGSFECGDFAAIVMDKADCAGCGDERAALGVELVAPEGADRLCADFRNCCAESPGDPRCTNATAILANRCPACRDEAESFFSDLYEVSDAQLCLDYEKCCDQHAMPPECADEMVGVNALCPAGTSGRVGMR